MVIRIAVICYLSHSSRAWDFVLNLWVARVLERVEKRAKLLTKSSLLCLWTNLSILCLEWETFA